jgi:hypothetical protein
MQLKVGTTLEYLFNHLHFLVLMALEYLHLMGFIYRGLYLVDLILKII